MITRPVGIHLSYWQRRWADDLAPLIRKARQAGFDGAEFPLLNPAALDLRGLRAVLDDQGLRATCGTGLGPATDITSPEGSIRAAGLRHLKTCLEAARALGSPLLGGVTYIPWGFFPVEGWSVRRKWCIESLREAGDIAGNEGVTLCLEVLNRFETSLINTVEQGLALLDEIDHPHIKLHLDTFHLNIEEDDIGAAIRLAGSAIGHFHCSENNRKQPGKGHIPWQTVRPALDDAGYTGWLVIESFVLPGDEVGPAVSVWRSLGADLDAEARAGADFVRQVLSSSS